ncbi:MAG: sugar ABC transporter permease [Bacillota bacterium]|nr:sugar ABC transporter permease [Bacillota bacterium]
MSKKGTKVMDKLRPYLFLSPAIISMVLLTFIPIIYTVYMSFTNRSMYHMDDYTFVGFKNYANVLTGDLRPIFLPVFLWTLLFAACTCLGGYFVGLLLAILLNNKNMKERGVYKAILILPWALPGTVAALSWQGLLNQQYGNINKLLKALHLIHSNVPWINATGLARFSVIMVSIWFTVPFMMNTCLGALTAIPDTYYEAADIDGASRWQKFIKITLPSLASSSYPLVISSFSMNFNNFGTIYMITKGQPAQSNYAGATDILASAAYTLIKSNNRYDLADTLAVLIFFVIGTISFIQMHLSGQFKEVDR